jgi:hypothetical protein
MSYLPWLSCTPLRKVAVSDPFRPDVRTATGREVHEKGSEMMRCFSRRLVTAALLGAGVLATTAAPQALADSAPGTAGPSVLVMTVADGTPGTPGATRTAALECGTPTGGDHPAPAAACAALEADDLDFTAPPTLQIMCPNIVQPVTVAAIGMWNGALVNYRHTYPNACVMHRTTGRLFDF